MSKNIIVALSLMLIICHKECFSQIRISNPEMEQYQNKADKLSDEKQYKKAIEVYLQGIKLNSSYPIIWNNMGYAYYKSGNKLSAMASYNQAIKLDPDFTLAYANRGQLNIDIQNFSAAVSDYDKAIAQSPKNAFYFYQRAGANANQNKLDKAIDDYDKTLEIDNTFIDALVYRAKAKTTLGQHDAALKDINKAIGLLPNYSNALNTKAMIQINSKDFYGALKSLDESIKLNPNDAESYFARGYVHQERKENLEAAGDYTQSLKINPENSLALNNLGVIAGNTGNYSLALERYKEAIDQYSSEGYYYINAISALARQRKFKDAAYYYALYKKKNLNFQMQEQSTEFYDSFLEAITKNIPEENYTQALSNIDLSISGFKKKFATDERDMLNEMIGFRAYVLEKSGKEEEALKIYQQVLLTVPQQPDIIEGMERINKKSGPKNQAEITILIPKPGNILKSGQQQIVGRINHAMAIKEVKVNGKIAEIEAETFTVSIPLITGINTIDILANLSAGQSISKKITVTAEKALNITELERLDNINPVDLSMSKYHAIIIAEENYKDTSIPTLKGPAKDALKLKEILSRSYGFNEENIEFLKDKSREEILEGIKTKSKSLSSKDNLLIFYAGHGVSEIDKQGIEYVYMIPSSATKGLSSTYISYSEINAAIANSASKHILLIADACSSGAASRSLGNDASELLQTLDARQSRTMMTSGEKEVPDNSIFFSLLLNRMELNQKKYIRARTLFDSLEENVFRETKTRPNYQEIIGVGDKGGDFIFIRSN